MLVLTSGIEAVTIESSPYKKRENIDNSVDGILLKEGNDASMEVAPSMD
jgi:hypothetical protein